MTSGNTNAWDASEYVSQPHQRDLDKTNPRSSHTLNRLRDTAALSSYRLHLLYVIANQAKLLRAAAYDRPDWAHTLDALNKGPPATVADLHAMAVEHIRDLRHA